VIYFSIKYELTHRINVYKFKPIYVQSIIHVSTPIITIEAQRIDLAHSKITRFVDSPQIEEYHKNNE